MSDDTKTCPACGQQIKAAAVVCRFCQSDLRAAGGAPRTGLSTGMKVLIALAIVGGCGLVLVIPAAIAIPGVLAAQRASNERNASASLKTITTAEADFRANDRDENGVHDFWVKDVRALCYYEPRRGDRIKLIESSLADADAGGPGPVSKAGYLYRAIERDETGAPYDDGTGRNANKFGFCAYPQRHPSSGKLTFIVNEDYALWAKDTGGQPVTEWPRHPSSEGWRRLD